MLAAVSLPGVTLPLNTKLPNPMSPETDTKSPRPVPSGLFLVHGSRMVILDPSLTYGSSISFHIDFQLILEVGLLFEFGVISGFRISSGAVNGRCLIRAVFSGSDSISRIVYPTRKLRTHNQLVVLPKGPSPQSLNCSEEIHGAGRRRGAVD